jgi:hypothetical protein
MPNEAANARLLLIFPGCAKHPAESGFSGLAEKLILMNVTAFSVNGTGEIRRSGWCRGCRSRRELKGATVPDTIRAWSG